MKIRALLKRIRLRSLQVGDGERSIDNVDALSGAINHSTDPTTGGGAVSAPPGWVPSQQDWGRPKH
jgi:hypothetical protein